jgi:D-beta-D-heptose 7-phosphate kinase/D-beta-D-heptose 1-phosphate adenosyltransferase
MTIDIKKFAGCRILVVGDLMVDEYLWGNVERISPEAPVQVVSVASEEYALGGAGNVVSNLVALGAKAAVAGVIGSGASGKLILEKLNALGVDTRGVIQDHQRTTTRKTRIIANHQHVLRFDREVKTDITRQTMNKITHAAGEMIADADLILVSDYNKGLITKALMTKLIAAAQKHNKLLIVDPKGRDFNKYAGASLITPNKKETALAAGIEIVDQSSLAEAARRLIKKTGIDKILVTCGKEGMVYFQQDTPPYQINTKAHQVFDVSGAGDTVLAVLGLGIAAGYSNEEAVALANTAAGIVVGKVGTATVSKTELAAALDLIPALSLDKQKTLAEVAAVARKLEKIGKRVVLTNGCFDLLHVGHIKLLSASKKLGDVLIVALDDDESVKQLKGSGRPIINENERLRIISALDSVDYVLVFSSHELNDVIEAIRPAVLTKGSNYGTEAIRGREIVERYGGRVEIIPLTENISSTRIINNIKTS